MKPRIAMVPLDSRPCCLEYPKRLAAIAGCHLVVPDSAWYIDFMQPADGIRLREWLDSIASDVDYLVLSAEMLVYGGLAVASRYLIDDDTALSRLDALSELKAANEHLSILLSTVINRTSKPIYTKDDYTVSKNLVDYSRLDYQVHHLGRQEMLPELTHLRASIPLQELEEYLQVRRRNHRVNKRVLELTAQGIVDFSVIAQADATSEGLHKLEQQELLRQIHDLNIPHRVIIYPGADEVNQVLLARAILDYYGRRIRFFPRYSTVSGRFIVSDYEDIAVDSSIRSQVFALGGVVVDAPSEADLVLMVNTPPKQLKTLGLSATEAEQRKIHLDIEHHLWDFIQGIDYYLNTDRAIAVLDIAFPNGSDKWLVPYLRNAVSLARLTAYAGWNTAGNSIGTAISHGAIRVLAQERPRSLEQEESHLSFLFERFVDDYLYQSVVRDHLNQYIIETLLHQDLFDLSSVYTDASKRLEGKLGELAHVLFAEHFLEHRLTEPFARYAIEGISEEKIWLPGRRTFEVGVHYRFAVEERGMSGE